VSEQSRLAAVHSYGLLDAARPVVLDDLTRLAARIFDTPMSTVSLIDRDRQWFAGATGMSGNEDPRGVSFCACLVDDPRPLVVEDAREDDRFRSYANVTGAPFIRFYAGAPLVSDEGYVLGSVCVIDREPRSIGDRQVAMLGDLAAQAYGHLAAVRDQLRLTVLDRELTRLTRREQDLIATVSHELRTPVATMQGYLEMLAEQPDLAPYRRLIEPIRRNGDRLVRMVDHLLAGARPDDTPPRAGRLVDLADAARAAGGSCETLAAGHGVSVTFESKDQDQRAYVVGEAAALVEAVEHLIRNAILFSPPGSAVRVRLDGAAVEVSDNGPGIPDEELPYVFDRFYRGRLAAEQAVPGMGLGLTIAGRIVSVHGGRLALASGGLGHGTLARIVLPAAGPIR
jgi:signal transduction histidine kinase